MASREYGFIIIASLAIAIATPLAAVAYEPAASQRASYRIIANNLECIEIPDGSVTIAAHGFLINESSEFVPQDQSQPSTDGRFWRCGTAERRTFFFVPLDLY
jgi:hypothetical protein